MNTNESKTPSHFNFSLGREEQITTLGMGEITVSASGEFYEPPYLLECLGRLKVQNAYHGSAIVFRRNMLTSVYQCSGLSHTDFRNCVTDFYTLGFCAIQLIKNKAQSVIGMKHIPALCVRIGVKENVCYFIQKSFDGAETEIAFKPNEVLIIKEYDPMQEVYGVPDWLGGMESALLSVQATMFRRRYYQNGAHMGYIFYSTNASFSLKDQEDLKKAIENGKGIGNFKTMFVHVPNGGENGIKLIPVGDIGQKDDFEKIKNISSEDVYTSHRIPPALMGIPPRNAGGYGAIDKITEAYYLTEVEPATNVWTSVNSLLPKILQFKFNIPTQKKD